MEISLVYDGGGGGGLRGWCQLYIVGFIWANQNPLKIQSVIHLLTGFILFPAFRFGDFYFVFLYLWIIVVVVVMLVGWVLDRFVVSDPSEHLVTGIHQQITIKNDCYEEEVFACKPKRKEGRQDWWRQKKGITHH